MHVKQIIIQGFCSYKDQTIIDPFSPGHNCVVGQNGTGKSNFFKAIRFILGDILSTGRHEDKVKLLHEGSGAPTISAFVEVIFDNSDHRFPSDKDEVVIKREIGAKKDEYFLDRKHTTKADIQAMLETVGFSRSNPYYIVQQGKINDMALMSDEDRLVLLKEVAGTRVYDERREESQKIMRDTDAKRQQIEEQYQFIEQRLGELEHEKEELKEYHKLDKERRALEYTIFETEMKEAEVACANTEKAQKEQQQLALQKQDELHQAQELQQESHNGAKAGAAELDEMKKSRDAVEVDKQAKIKIRTRAELAYEELKEGVSGDSAAQTKARKDLDKVRRDIAKATETLEQRKSVWEEALAAEQEKEAAVTSSKRRLDALYAKQGRQQQYTTQQERDEALKKQIKLEKVQLAEMKTQKEKQANEIGTLNKSLNAAEAEIDRLKGTMEKYKASKDSANESEKELKFERDTAQNERKVLWRNKSNLEKQIRTCSEEINNKNHQLNSLLKRDLRNGLENCLRLVEKHHIKGVHGPLIELFTCDKAFSTAVEVTAGNKLFNVVVDNDNVAAKVLELLGKQKDSGRVTFMPLNRLTSSKITYPDTTDAFSMLSKLEFEPVFEKAFQQVFGRTLICRSLDSGRKLSRQYQLDAVTLDGDQCSNKGSFTGGSIEWKVAKVDIVRQRRERQGEYAEAESELQKIQSGEGGLEEKITKLNSQVRQSEQSRYAMKNEHDDMKDEVKKLVRDVADKRALAEQKVALCDKMERTLTESGKTLSELTVELKSAFDTELTAKEQSELRTLNNDLPDLQDELVKLGHQRAGAESEKDECEEALTGNLVQQQEELESDLQNFELNTGDRDSTLEQHKEIFDAAAAAVSELEDQQKILDKDTQAVRKTQNNHLKEAEAQRKIIDGCQGFVESEGKRLEKLISSSQVLQAKAEEASRKIASLGLLPETFAKFNNKSTKELMKLLQKCNEKLKKFSHVNKKALDQHVQFTEQCELLRTRKQELDNGSQAIQQLITQLDNKKNEAILRTFKGVSKHFTNVFKELVPIGNGNLVMRRKRDEDQEEGNNPAGGKNDVEQFTGVGIKVSFTGQGQQMMMKQLSGGQKSLVALALVFSIQRCDPAPFYLFDEIDAALDPVARTAVANMIRRQSSSSSDTPTQFITTTFRPELVNAADKHYQISFANKVSRINSVNIATAMKSIAPH